MVRLMGSAAAIVVLAGCGGHDLNGTMTISKSFSSGSACTGTGGYDDIHAGTQVVVRDEAGKVLATGALGEGSNDGSGSCVFHFTVQAVSDANFYSVEVSHRGQLTYSKADLDKRNWAVALELG